MPRWNVQWGARAGARAIDMELAPGTLLCADKFEVIRRLGSGGSSDIFEALHTRLNKRVALKLLPISAQSDLLARRETLSASIQNPHIIQIFDLEVDAPHDALVIAMELLDGASLNAVLNARRALPDAECITVLRQALTGIASAHARGIVHGDLKPGNVFCATTPGSERIVLLDFGIASLAYAGSEAMTRTVGGTPLWMNPEAVSGRDRTWRADTWAIGLLAYMMVTGEHYFGRPDSHASLAAAILAPDKQPPSRMLRERSLTPPAWLDALFFATVNADEQRLLEASALLALLPDVPSAVPHAEGPVPSKKAISTNIDALGPTQVDARAFATARPIIAQGDHSSMQHRVARILPDALRPSAPEIGAFIEALFDDASPQDGILRLMGPRLDFAKGYDFFLAALASRHESAIQTMTFLAYAMNIEDVLAALDSTTLKVVIVVLDTPELGHGVRSKIAELFRKYRAALIPVFVRDISRLRANEAKNWLRQRWQQNKPVTNPFEPRVFDRTLLHGHVEVINGFVQELTAGPGVFGVYGAPGCGKTSVVRHVQDEFANDADFYWLNCGTALRLPPKELLERAADVFHVPFTIVDGRPSDTLSAGVAAALNRAQQARRRVVVVLDDADVLVDPERLAANATDATFYLQIRHQLAKLLAEGGLALVIIGLRTFMLEREVIGDGTNPLRPFFRKVRVPPLRPPEIAELCNLGKQVDLHFQPQAVERLHRWASGNVQAAQMICGKVLELAGETERAIAVDAKCVDTAADALVNSWESFDKRLIPYLTSREKEVLATVPRTTVKNALQLVPLLPDASDAEIGRALDYLVEMGVVTRSNGKLAVAGKLLEAWVKTNLTPPVGPERKRKEDKLRVAALGIALTALLYGAYAIWFSTGQQTIVTEHDGCATHAYAPRRVTTQSRPAAPRMADKVTIILDRKCERPRAGAIELRAAHSTRADFGGGVMKFSKQLDAAQSDWTQEIDVKELVTADGDPYELELTADGLSDRFAIRRNWLGELPGFLRALVAAAGAIPALLGLLTGFYGDVRKWVASLAAKDS